MRQKKDSFTRDDTKVIKAIAIFLMLWHHLFCFPERLSVGYHHWPEFTNMPPFEMYLGGVGKLCVAIFLIMGGMGTYYSLKKCKSAKQRQSSALKKVKNLYLCYWKVFLIAIPISFLLHSGNVNLDANEIIWNFFGVHITFCGEWWFFTTYVILTLFSPMIIRVVDSKRLNELSSCILIVMIGIFCSLFLPMILNIYPLSDDSNYLWRELKLVLANAPFFIAGCMIARFDLLGKIKQKLGNNYLYGLLSLLTIGVCIWLHGHNAKHYDLFIAMAIISSVTIIFTMPIMRYLKKLLVFIGNQSTNMWLLHSMFCYHWIQRVIFWPNRPLLIFALLVVISLVSGLVLDYFWKFVAFLWRKIKLKEKLSYKPIK